MADVILRIVNEGVTAATEGVGGIGKAYDDLSKKSKEATATQSKGFKDSADGAEKLNKVLADAKPTVQLGKQRSEVQKLKQEIKDYTSAALKAGQGTKEFAAALAEAGKRKADLKDLQTTLNQLDPDKKAQAFLQLGQTILTGFAAGTGALSAFGVSTEDAAKTLVKLQAALAFGQFLGQLGELQDTFANIKTAIQNSTVAQKAFNLVASANPYVLIGIAVGAAAAAFALSSSAVEEDTEAFRKNNEFIKAATSQRRALQDALDDVILALQVEEGLLSQQQADIIRIKTKASRDIVDLEKEKKEAVGKLIEQSIDDETGLLDKIAGATGVVGLQIIAASNSAADAAKNSTKRRLEIEEEFEATSKKIAQKAVADINLLEAKEINKGNTEKSKLSEDAAKRQKAQRDKLLEDTKFEVKQASDDEVNTRQENNQRILSNAEQLIDAQNQILFRDQDARRLFLETFGKSDLELKIKQLEDERKEVLDNTAFTEKERLAITEDTEKKISELKQAQLNSQLQGLSAQFANIQALENAFGSETKAGASAQALIATYLSAQKSFAFGAGIGGPILGGIFAAIATAAGLANVAKINEVQFAEGGYTGDGGKYDEAGTVHRGEFVMTKEKTRKHRDLFEAIHNDQQLGFADLSSLLKGTGVSLNPDIPGKILKSYDISDQKQTSMRSDADKRLANIEKELKLWRAESNSKEQHTNTPDGHITKKGNVTRIVRRRKS